MPKTSPAQSPNVLITCDTGGGGGVRVLVAYFTSGPWPGCRWFSASGAIKRSGRTLVEGFGRSFKRSDSLSGGVSDCSRRHSKGLGLGAARINGQSDARAGVWRRRGRQRTLWVGFGLGLRVNIQQLLQHV